MFFDDFFASPGVFFFVFGCLANCNNFGEMPGLLSSPKLWHGLAGVGAEVTI